MIENSFTTQYFLSLFERLLPYDYLYPLETTGPGYELFHAFSKIGERLSLAVKRLDDGLYVITAPPASFTEVEVLLSRPLSSTSVGFTELAGTVIETRFGGRKFELLEDVIFGPLEAGPKPVRAKAFFPSYQWNVLGRQETPDGEELAGEISKVVSPFQRFAFSEPFIQVSQLEFASGGVPGFLEQLGLERGIPRVIGEGVEEYRSRLQSLPDTVSPAAMKRNLDLIWKPLLLDYSFIETWEITYQSCYDSPSTPISGSLLDPTTFVYDDPRPTTPFKNRWLDDIEFRGAFIVVLPVLTSFLQRSVAVDDTGILNIDFETPYGKRACPAFDITSDLPDVDLLLGFFDGYDVDAQAYYVATNNTLQNIKPAGVAAILELEGN